MSEPEENELSLSESDEEEKPTRTKLKINDTNTSYQWTRNFPTFDELFPSLDDDDYSQTGCTNPFNPNSQQQTAEQEFLRQIIASGFTPEALAPFFAEFQSVIPKENN